MSQNELRPLSKKDFSYMSIKIDAQVTVLSPILGFTLAESQDGASVLICLHHMKHAQTSGFVAWLAH